MQFSSWLALTLAELAPRGFQRFGAEVLWHLTGKFSFLHFWVTCSDDMNKKKRKDVTGLTCHQNSVEMLNDHECLEGTIKRILDNGNGFINCDQAAPKVGTAVPVIR